MNILVTGGAGYIGSHTCVELLDAGFAVTVFDNFCNSHPEALARVERITGKRVSLIRGDVRDRAALVAALRDSGARAVIHFAGLKAVGESLEKPLFYYDNNVVGTLRLLEAMGECGVKTLVFSSSATVYGDPQYLPLTEDHPLSTTNPYGRSKLIIEEILRDLYRSDPAVLGINLLINDGPAANQHVPHLHLHLIPRRVGDLPALCWRTLTRFLPFGRKRTEARLAGEAERLRAALAEG